MTPLEVLEECEEYFDNRADADYDIGAERYISNPEMKLLCMVREAIAELKGASK